MNEQSNSQNETSPESQSRAWLTYLMVIIIIAVMIIIVLALLGPAVSTTQSNIMPSNLVNP